MNKKLMELIKENAPAQIGLQKAIYSILENNVDCNEVLFEKILEVVEEYRDKQYIELDDKDVDNLIWIVFEFLNNKWIYENKQSSIKM